MAKTATKEMLRRIREAIRAEHDAELNHAATLRRIVCILDEMMRGGHYGEALAVLRERFRQ